MMPASVLLALLSFSPPADAAAEPPAPAVSPEPQRREYEAALESVRTAQRMANEDPQRGSVQLRDALVVLSGYGTMLAKDPEGQDLRTMAQLTLARALLATDNANAAREAMDDAIRTARGDPLPTKQFGPGLTALHKERAGALAKLGSGTIAIQCNVPCRVYINERPTKSSTDGLVPGKYRVWIEASDGSQPDVQSSLEVEAEQTASIEYGVAPIIEDGPKGETKSSKRIMPRWAEAVLMSAGAVAIGTGAALWAIDGSCPDGADRTDVVACPLVYITKTSGIVFVAAGSALFLSGTISLAVDEVRLKREPSQPSSTGTAVTLQWTKRF
ncbi:tetratricopeptide repeat protein [Enhygromyxa salina]|nr:tetratricopeptide repeat protein [Enhygromyxa salina]